MKKQCIGLALWGVAIAMPAAASAQQGVWAPAIDSTAQWMVAREREWAESSCTRNMVERTLLAEDFQGTSPSGQRYSKTDALADSQAPGPPDRNCRLIDARVRFFGADLAIVYGSESWSQTGPDGAEITRSLIWTDTWLKRGGVWQIIAAQDMRADCR